MTFFDREIAEALQHVALVIEISALVLVLYDLKAHEKDKGRARTAIFTLGWTARIPDRSRWYFLGIALAFTAILMEGYQLACLYFAE